MSLPVTAEDVLAAVDRIRHVAQVTPLIRNANLDEAVGARVLIKPECLQVTGSFKIRGATNRISKLSDGERAMGVVAFSSGNHAQGVARAARLFDCPATIVMPRDAPKVKLEGVRADGAEIVLYERESESREKIAAEICRKTGATLIPSYDDPDIVAGQGTVGLEIARQAEAMDEQIDHLIVCTGGGGLITGSALGLKTRFPGAEVWTAEPDGHDDWAMSLARKEIVANAPGTRSICDAILTPEPGRIPFEIALKHVSGGFKVSDHDVKHAMRFAFRHLRLVAEPGGAVALATALSALPETMKSKTIVVVITGGNVDPELFASVLQET